MKVMAYNISITRSSLLPIYIMEYMILNLFFLLNLKPESWIIHIA